MYPIDYEQPHFYHFSQDSIWLAQKVAEFIFREGPFFYNNYNRMIDIGAGSGVVGMETWIKLFHLQASGGAKIEAKFKELIFLEPQKDFFPFLKNNVEKLRGIEEALSISYIHGGISEFFHKPGLLDHSILIFNPPYFYPGEGKASVNEQRHMCRHWNEDSFGQWQKFQLIVDQTPCCLLFYLTKGENRIENARALDQIKNLTLWVRGGGPGELKA